MRALLGLGRVEDAFFQARDAAALGIPNGAELADASGYADQPHLCREVKRATGFSPDEFLRRLREDESFWAYRLWA
jgi:AraC-like DNA-binding protein